MKDVTTKGTRIMNKAKKFIWSMYAAISCMSANALTAFAENDNGNATATTDGGAANAWNSILDAIKPFLVALGGIMVLVGGINLALGFKSEDADGIQRGVRTLIAGVAVLAVIGVAWAYVKVTG